MRNPTTGARHIFAPNIQRKDWDTEISTHFQIIKENKSVAKHHKNLPLPAIDWAALCARRAAALDCCGWVTDRPRVSSRPSPHGQPQRNYGSSAASHHWRALQLANLTANDKLSEAWFMRSVGGYPTDKLETMCNTST